MNNQSIEDANAILQGLKRLGRNRKVVLSHHKAFELKDDLEARAERLLASLKNSGADTFNAPSRSTEEPHG